MRRIPAALVALAAVSALVAPGAGAAAPSFVAGSRGFHSVLAYGQGEGTTALSLARNLADGSIPPSFTSQAAMYDRVITTQPLSDGDLSNYYKDSSFAQITGDTETPIAGARIVRDPVHRIPHIYGDTRAAAMYAVGYATAEDRLFLMDVLRRTAEGSTAELLGPDALPADSAALGQFDRSPQELTDEIMRLAQDEGPAGARALADFQQYVKGINAFIDETKTNPTKLPAEYPALGVLPRAWTLADSAATGYLLIARFTVFGDGEYLQADVLSRLQKRLGAVRGRALYDDLRNLEDPTAPVTADRRFDSDRPARGRSSAVQVDAGKIVPRNAVVGSDLLKVQRSAFPTWAHELATKGLRLERHASNALLIGASHSASGHALAAMGPQLQYYSPELVVEYEVHAPGLHSSGMSVPGTSPYPLIGHTAGMAWSGTTANGDNADTFAEQLCEPSGAAPTLRSDHYRYRGRCIAFTHRDQVLQTPLAPTGLTDPATYHPPRSFTLRTMRSVHGPIHDFAAADGTLYALARATAVNGRGIRSLVAFEGIAEGRAETPATFVATMHHYTGNENWFFVNSRHIAWLQSGWFPEHAPGTDLEMPVLGTGQWDWLGFNPTTGSYARHGDSFNPMSIDPKQGYIASWNNKGARGWRAAPGIWSYGRVHRDELLRDPVLRAFKAGHKLTLAQVVGISGNASTQDLRAVEVLPDLLSALGTPRDPQQQRLVGLMRRWLASGAHRRSTTGRAWDDDSAAVLVFDEWWRQLAHGIFDPQAGRDVINLLQQGIELVLDQRPVYTGFYDGWYGQVSDIVRASLGTQHQLRVARCGTGTLAGCRSSLQRSFAVAVAALVKQYGDDPGSWHKPVLCPDDESPTCDENRPTTAGALATPSHPFENRGTFHQAVEVLGP